MKILLLTFPSMPHKRGLTLVEILVVITIFSIISVILFTVFRSGLESFRRAESNLEIYQNGRIALDIITRDLRAALLDPYYLDGFNNPRITFRAFNNGGAAPPWGWKPNSIGDEVYFVAALNPTDTNVRFDLCQVGYWLNGKGTADTKDDELARYYYAQTGATPDYDFSAGAGASTPVAKYVTELNFRYWDSVTNNWSAGDTWDSRPGGAQDGRLPRMVQITIKVREPHPLNPSSPKEEQFITNVYIPRSQR